MNENLNLNEAQLKWLCKKQNEMIDYIEHHWPLTDEQWESVTDFITKTYEDSKKNNEVAKGLREVVESYDRLANADGLLKHGCISEEEHKKLKTWEQELVAKSRKE